MIENKQDTEKVILEAARKVFIRKGLDGTRMQEIADEAGINKALLHYYFRSKDKLFEIIFSEAISSLFPEVSSVLVSEDMPVESKIRVIIDRYVSLFLQNPFLPLFVIREINRDSESVLKMFEKVGVNIEFIQNVVLKRFAEVINTDVHGVYHFIVNVLSLCIFPFAGRPLLEKILFDGNTQAYNQFLEQRKEAISEFVISAIRGGKCSEQ